MLPAEVPAEQLGPLREACVRAGYTEQGLLALFGPTAIPERPGRQLPYLLRIVRREDPLQTLVKLFFLGTPVPEAVVRAALGDAVAESCLRWGLLEGRQTLRARYRLAPYRGLLLASDLAERPEVATRADQVMGITASSAALADFTIRGPCRRVLDLGTGCGVQALLATRHSSEVVATDCNPRAVALARFNARLNNCTGICFLEGDAFAPVRGRRFDRILVNPPFAVSPWQRYLYRDGAEPGDAFCRRLVSEAPAFLEEGGYLQMTLDWAEYAGQDWKQRLAGWFEGGGCDVWVLRLQRSRPAAYAYMWVRDTEPEDPALAGKLFEEWTAFFDAEGIEAVSTGLLAMRRRPAASNWLRMEEAPETMTGPVGEWVALGFALQDYLNQASDELLLGEKLRLARDARLFQQSEARQGRWQPAALEIRLTRGLAWRGNLDVRLAPLLARFDGRRALRDLLIHLAVELGADPDRLIAACLPLLRDCILRGFLLPEGIREPDLEPQGV